MSFKFGFNLIDSNITAESAEYNPQPLKEYNRSRSSTLNNRGRRNIIPRPSVLFLTLTVETDRKLAEIEATVVQFSQDG